MTVLCVGSVRAPHTRTPTGQDATIGGPERQVRTFCKVLREPKSQISVIIIPCMATQGWEDERRRLAELYATKSDAELEQLADHEDSLTSVARLALHEELERRELDSTPAQPPAPEEEPEFNQLLTIRQFRDLPEALLAKGFLESAGIECFLADDNIVRMDWFISNFVGGIKLQVRPPDAEAAVEVLNQPIPEEFSFEGETKFRQPRCPKCCSLDISFEGLNKEVAYTSAWLGVPIPLTQKTWKCLTCGRRWVEEEPAKNEEV